MQVITIFCPKCDKGTSFDMNRLIKQDAPLDGPCYNCGTTLYSLEDMDEDDLIPIDEIENKESLV